MERVNIYTRTSIRSPNEEPGNVIFILETQRDGKPYRKSFIEKVNGSWNGTALKAVLLALKKLNYPCDLVIYTDNPYVEINIERAKKWQKEGWGEHKYKEEWQQILKLLEPCTYKISSGDHIYTSEMLSDLKRQL